MGCDGIRCDGTNRMERKGVEEERRIKEEKNKQATKNEVLRLRE